MGKNQSKETEYAIVKPHEIYSDYVIHDEVIGTGASGDIITCTNKKTKIKYALKILYYSNAAQKKKARDECELHWLASRNCPYIVKLVDIYKTEMESHKAYLLIMELMKGGKLLDRLNELAKSNNPLTEQNVAKMMCQLTTAVKHLHELDIAHRDIQPENLLLSSNDVNAVIKLVDFGSAIDTRNILADKINGNEDQEFVEFARNNEFASDIWGLGVIWYILCSGHSPLDKNHGIHITRNAFDSPEWKRVSPEVKELLNGMLEPDSMRRLKINEIMNSRWITQFATTPKTPLSSVFIWKENYNNWDSIKKDIEIAYNDMRINWNNKIPLKDLTMANNPLLERRRKKKENANSSNSNLESISTAGSIQGETIQKLVKYY